MVLESADPDWRRIDVERQIDVADELSRARFDLLVSDVLKIRELAPRRFEAAASPGVFDRIYGGQVLAQSLIVAATTLPSDRRLHSLHSYFLRLGQPATAVQFDVAVISDTQAFSTRSVQATQGGETIVTALLSFHSPTETFPAHQDPMPTVPPPEDFASRDSRMLEHFGDNLPLNSGLSWPVEIRYVDREPWESRASNGRNRMWVRTPRPIRTDATRNAALLLFASDLTMFEPVIARHDLRWEDLIGGTRMFGATLDHSFWLHKDVVFDDWLLHVQESTVAANGRGFATGRFYTRGGELVASVAQEVVIKPIHRPHATTTRASSA
jgi:acyl-CoA thioesterase II